ncbi:Uncharacterised protein [Mycobacteroides abscessus]|nr:Uncharacterised protein [Mycobacteroides abscessus]
MMQALFDNQRINPCASQFTTKAMSMSVRVKTLCFIGL